MLTLLTLLTASALATPDRVAYEVELGSNADRLAASSEARIAAALTGSGVAIIDGWSWEITYLTGVCSDPRDLAVWSGDGGDTATVWVACGDGTVVPVEVGEDRQVSEGDAVAISSYAAVGVEAGEQSGEPWLWVVTEAESNLEVQRVDLGDYTVEGTVWTLSQSSFADVEQDGNYLIVVHGGDDTSKVDLTGTSSALSIENLGGRSLADAVVDGSSGRVFIADADGGLVEFTTGDNSYAIVLDDEDGLTGNPAAELAWDVDEPWLAMYDDGASGVLFFDYQSGGVSDEAFQTLDAPGVQSLVRMDAYLLGGASDGVLEVMTRAPWVTVESDASGTLTQGDTFKLSFSADLDGDWEVFVGAPSGDALASGSLTAGGSSGVELTVDDDYAEGTNAVYVVVTGDYGDEGSGGVSVDVDNPPSQVALTSDDVSFGEEVIYLNIPGISDEDLDSYEVYVTTVAFERADWSSGGPDYEGDDDLDAPITLDAADGVAPDTAVSYTIQPVTNGVTYYVAVRAVDSGGLEGPMSEVFSVVPQNTLTASELAGEPGGCQGASTTGGAAGLALAGLAGLAALRRRRRWGLLAAALLALPTAAQAQEKEPRPKKVSSTELRLGPTTMEDPSGAITAVYGDGSYLSAWMEGGPQLWRVLELDLGLGYIRKKGYLVGEEDNTLTSTEQGRLTLLPMSVALTARAEFLREQWVVPFARVGADYWAWMETVDDGTSDTTSFLPDERYSGGKPGYHWGYGVDILLDPLDRGRASLADARWGIHDTYLVVEWREHRMLDSNTGFDFSNKGLSFGLKIDR